MHIVAQHLTDPQKMEGRELKMKQNPNQLVDWDTLSPYPVILVRTTSFNDNMKKEANKHRNADKSRSMKSLS